jgi:mannose-1-phosphate guanylyltransferase
MNNIHKASNIRPRCGIVLAAGEGTRLRPFVRQLRGDDLPKQYVRFIGTRSLLEHTLSRAELLIPPERLFTVIGQAHLDFPEVERQLSGCSKATVVVQPENKETGPGILLPLMHLYRRYPDSNAVVLPSDHFIMEESLFMAHVELAFRVVEQHPSCLVLLGVEPDQSEPDYGYIMPGKKLEHLAPVAACEVLSFVEKPDSPVALELISRGGLWNTFVMVFNVRGLLELVRRTIPSLFRSFELVCEAIGTPEESAVTQAVYRRMEAVNFSRALLEVFSLKYPARLLVLPVRGVLWSDWGSQQRIVSILSKTGAIEQPGKIPDYAGMPLGGKHHDGSEEGDTRG